LSVIAAWIFEAQDCILPSGFDLITKDCVLMFILINKIDDTLYPIYRLMRLQILDILHVHQTG